MGLLLPFFEQLKIELDLVGLRAADAWLGPTLFGSLLEGLADLHNLVG